MTTQPDDPSFARRSWKWLIGVLLTALGLVVAGYIAEANYWLRKKVTGPEQALSVVVTIKSPARDCEGQAGWIFPVKPNKLPPWPNASSSEEEWARQSGGIPASGNYITVTLQARGERTVVATDLRVEVLARRRPTAGTHPISGGCGGLTPTLFKAYLDTSPIRVKPTAGRDSANKPIPPVALPHIISEKSPEQWQIAGITSSCDCKWVAYIDYTADGVRGEAKIDDNGEPFRSVAVSRAAVVVPDYDPDTGKSRGWVVVESPS